MHLNQHIQTQGLSHFVEIAKILIREDRSDQQHRIRTSGTRLKKLVRTQNKLFAEQGQINGFTHLHKNVKTTLKKTAYR
jgi:hypothetical protein